MDTKLLFTLLKRVHYYYPIGFPNWNDAYPGYQELLSIIENKVNHLFEHKVEPWNTLVQSLTAQIKHDFILDQAYQQFPNLLLSIDLSKAKTDNIEQKKTLYLCLSLLTQHFTIFIENEYKFVNFPSKNKSKYGSLFTPQTVIIYGVEYSTQEELEIFNLIKNKVKESYPDYVFVVHGLLMNFKIIGGTPHSEFLGIKDSYSIYNYLFEMRRDIDGIHILD